MPKQKFLCADDNELLTRSQSRVWSWRLTIEKEKKSFVVGEKKNKHKKENSEPSMNPFNKL